MNTIPRLQPQPIPEGYFDTLPEKIISRQKGLSLPPKWGWAAAAVLLLGVGMWQGLDQKREPTPLSVDEEALLYIESGQWSTEDILSMSDNPNEILDQIIEEEFSKTEPLWTEEETWY
jgi:hypothetical protein